MRDNPLGSPIPLGALLPTAILFFSLTHVFFILLLYIKDQIGKHHQSIRSHPIDTSWFLGLYVGTYIISCSLLLSGLEVTIRLDGVFVAIYLASAMANIISLFRVSNWPFARRVKRLDLNRELVRYLEEHGRWP